MKKVKCDCCRAGGKGFCDREALIRKDNGPCEYFRLDWKRMFMRLFRKKGESQ